MTAPEWMWKLASKRSQKRPLQEVVQFSDFAVQLIVYSLRDEVQSAGTFGALRYHRWQLIVDRLFSDCRTPFMCPQMIPQRHCLHENGLSRSSERRICMLFCGAVQQSQRGSQDRARAVCTANTQRLVVRARTVVIQKYMYFTPDFASD